MSGGEEKKRRVLALNWGGSKGYTITIERDEEMPVFSIIKYETTKQTNK